MLDPSRLADLLRSFSDLDIALLGDLFLDRYLELEPDSRELSIETGLEAYQVRRVRNAPGALGTVMNNLAALGVGRLTPVTVIGDDGHGFDLLKALDELPVDRGFVIQSATRLTPTYTKPMRRDADGPWRELNRLDVRTRSPLTARELDRLKRHLNEAVRRCDGLIVLDQVSEDEQGVVNSEMRELLSDIAAGRPELLILVDSRARIHRFRGVTLKGNESEFCRAAESEDARSAVRRLAASAGRPVFCTMSSRGMLIGDPEGETEAIPGFPVEGPVDIVGAGDSATSGIVSGLLSGATPAEAAELGNLVASVTVRQLGTTGTASAEQLMERLSRGR